MAEKSIKKNFIFNIIYQVLSLILPLVIMPYVSRVLGVDGIGEYSYASSIVSYFTLFAVLGTTTFGQRAIGYTQKSIKERSRAFWEVYLLRTITASITLVAYAVFVLVFVDKSNLTIYLILALNILNVIVDISWFFYGMEEFGKTVSTSILFRLIYLCLIFVLIKSATDLWVYVLLTIAQLFLCNLALWLYLPKYICRVKGIKPFRDITSVLQLFLPTIATQIYGVMDKSMIGWFIDNYSENGYYEQADRIVKITLALITALGTVMIPRISRYHKEGDDEKVKYYIYKSYRFIWMLAVPIMMGLIVVSNIFVPIFFGAGYEKCTTLISILSCLTVFIGLSNVTGIQYLVPTGRQNILTMTVVVGAVVNVCLNLTLIPFFASVGAAIASIIAEFCVTVAGLIYVKRKHLYALKPIITCSWKYWIAGIIMFGAIFGVEYLLPVTVWALIVLILLGVIVYFLMLFVLRDSLLNDFIIKFVSAIKQKFSFSKSKAQTVTNSDDNTSELNGEDDKNIEDTLIGKGDVQDIRIDNKNNNKDDEEHEV